MKLKASTKLTELALDPNEVIKNDKCNNLKGGACCTRNKWSKSRGYRRHHR